MPKITLTELDSLTNETTALNALNTNFGTIQGAIDNLLSRDGTSPNTIEADLDMNSFRIENLPEAVGATEPVRLGDIPALLALETQPSKWYNGSGAPDNNLYEVGDYWLNTTNSDVYEKTGETAWTLVANFKGDTGPTGAPGAGTGDMLKSVYDANDDGVVTAAASAPWSGITSKPTTLTGYGITDAQPLSTKLTNFNALTWAANTFPVFTGTNTVQASQITSAGLALLDDASATAQRTTLGLGTMALRESISTGDIVAGAVTLAKMDTTGANGLVLTAQGAGVAPTWTSPGASSSGHVLLATLTPTAATTLTASGLTLTNYKRLYVVFNGVRPNTTTGTSLQMYTGSTVFATVSGNATNTSALTGSLEISLENGMGFRNTATASNGTPNSGSFYSTITNATTSVSFRFVTTTVQFSSGVGNIKIYGVL